MSILFTSPGPKSVLRLPTLYPSKAVGLRGQHSSRQSCRSWGRGSCFGASRGNCVTSVRIKHLRPQNDWAQPPTNWTCFEIPPGEWLKKSFVVSHGNLGFAFHGSFFNNFLIGWFSSTANKNLWNSPSLRLPRRRKYSLPCERACKTVSDTGVSKVTSHFVLTNCARLELVSWQHLNPTLIDRGLKKCPKTRDLTAWRNLQFSAFLKI